MCYSLTSQKAFKRPLFVKLDRVTAISLLPQSCRPTFTKLPPKIVKYRSYKNIEARYQDEGPNIAESLSAV